MECLLVIDMQTGYPNKFSPHLEDNVKACCSKFNSVFTLTYQNTPDTPVYRQLNWRCLMAGTSRPLPPFEEYREFTKSTYNGATSELLETLRLEGYTRVYLCGVYSEACVLATALALFDANFEVYVVWDCCEGTTPVLENAAREILHHNLGGNICTLDTIQRTRLSPLKGKPKSSFPTRLRELRCENTRIPEQVADMLGLYLADYLHLEYGTRQPSIEAIGRLANYFKVTTDYLLGYSDIRP